MTDLDRDNIRILEEHADEIAALEKTCGTQHALDFANRLIDVSAGIVAGDGYYYPRHGFPERDDIHAEDGDEWYRFQERKLAVIAAHSSADQRM